MPPTKDDDAALEAIVAPARRLALTSGTLDFARGVRFPFENSEEPAEERLLGNRRKNSRAADAVRVGRGEGA